MKKVFCLFLAGVLYLQVSAVNYCQTAAFGYGKSATGGTSTPTLVTSASTLKSALKSNAVVIVTQDITVTKAIELKDVKNLTVLALPGKKITSEQQNKDNSGIFYFKSGCSNIVLRNLTLVGPGAYDCDGHDLLSFEGVTNAWVDHCDFQDGVDGNFDNTDATDNITVSWCRFRYLKSPKPDGPGGTDDHRFTNLIGGDAEDKPSDGTYNITWAYCWWDNGCVERMTRCRNASLHFLNCYWNSSAAKCYIGPENVDVFLEGCCMEGSLAKEKYIKEYNSSKNGSKFEGCYFKNGQPSALTARTVATISYSYEKFENYTAAKTAVTNTSCGAGATLQVTEKGVVSSSCDTGGSQPEADPTLSNPNNKTQTVESGTAISTITFTASGTATNISVTNLPAGLKSQVSGLVLTITGTPTASGTYTVSTTNSEGKSVTTQGTITVNGGTTPPGPEPDPQPTATGDFTWFISDTIFSNHLGEIKATTTIDGLTLVATSGKVVTIEAFEKDKYKTFTEGDTTYKFTHVLKTKGTMNANYRYLKFEVIDSCTIDFYCYSGNSSNAYTMALYKDTILGTPLATLTADKTVCKQTYSYKGGSANILVGGQGNGIHFYAIRITYPKIATSIDVIQPMLLDMQAPMFNILGQPVDASYRGIVIQNGKKFMLQ